MIDDHQMVANRIKLVKVTPFFGHSVARLGTHLFIKDAVPQLLRGQNIGLVFRQADFETCRLFS